MNYQDFINRTNLAIKKNRKDEILLRHENKFLRALSEIYNFVNYQNQNLQSFDETIDLVCKTLKIKPTINIFLIRK